MLLLPDGNIVPVPEIIGTLREPSMTEVLSLLNRYVPWPATTGRAAGAVLQHASEPSSRTLSAMSTSSLPSGTTTVPYQGSNRPSAAQQHRDPFDSNVNPQQRTMGAVAVILRCWRLLKQGHHCNVGDVQAGMSDMLVPPSSPTNKLPATECNNHKHNHNRAPHCCSNHADRSSSQS